MDQDHSNVERTQHRNIHEDIGEILVGDDRPIHADDERSLPELRDVLQNAAQVS